MGEALELPQTEPEGRYASGEWGFTEVGIIADAIQASSGDDQDNSGNGHGEGDPDMALPKRIGKNTKDEQSRNGDSPQQPEEPKP